MSRRSLARHRFARTSVEGGGGGTGGDTVESATITTDTGATGDQQGQQQSGGNQQGQQTGQQWDGKVESLPADAQKMIRDLRTENADRRTKLTAAEQAQQDAIRALAKAAGIELPGDAQPDPKQLTEQLTAAQQAQRQTAVELAVYRTAGKHSGDPDALLDSRSFLNAVAELDPAANDFAANVDAAIRTAVDSNPKLKAGRVPGTSGADHPGGSGDGPRQPASLEEAVAQKLGA